MLVVTRSVLPSFSKTLSAALRPFPPVARGPSLPRSIQHSSIPTTPSFSLRNMSNVAAGVSPDAPAPSAVSNRPDVKRDAHPFSRSQLEGLMTKRFFYIQAFEIYGGVGGLYDYGPTVLLFRPTSSINGATTLSLKRRCSSSTPPS